MSLADRVAFITGASRGIGKACALACARSGMDVVVAAKTLEPNPRLPGTILDTAREVEALGRRALPLQLDVRDAAACQQVVARAIDHFGRLDALINNAGALYWHDIVDTPVKRFDLVLGVNARAAFVLTSAVLPHMLERDYGHVVMMSPPYVPGAAPHRAAYWISKYGMTLIAEAVAEECRGHNVTAHALWPATMIESQATMNFALGARSSWRKAEIVADATLALLRRAPSERRGGAYIDEDLLRDEGVSDFSKYRCDPQVEPPRIGLFSAARDSHGRRP